MIYHINRINTLPPNAAVSTRGTALFSEIFYDRGKVLPVSHIAGSRNVFSHSLFVLGLVFLALEHGGKGLHKHF